MSLRRLSAQVPPIGAYTPVGAMQHRITFYLPGDRDPNSGKSFPPNAGPESWAAIRALQGAELDKAQQIAQTISQLLTIPFQRGIAQNMTVKTGDGRTFQIKFIEDPDDRQVELRLYCAEVGQNAGQQP